jgi:MSV199 domain
MASTSLITVSTNKYIVSLRDDDKLFKLLESNMNTEDQKLFIKSFYLYLEHGNKEDVYVINLEDIYEWLGYSRKDPAKRLLINNFQENIHYIIQKDDILFKSISHVSVENTIDTKKGRKTENILLNINTFKKLCMKASTKRADEICDYYLKMENIYHQYIKEKISETNNKLIELKNNNKIEFIKAKNNQLLTEYENESGAYILLLEPNIIDESLYFNFGSTNNITRRMKEHKNDFKDKIPYLYLFYSTKHYLNMEQKIRNDYFISKNKIKYNNHNEMFVLNNNKDSLEYLNKLFKNIIKIIKEQFESMIDNSIELKKLEIKEKELETKQIEIQETEKTKQKQEETKQLELQLELKKIELQLKKSIINENQEIKEELIKPEEKELFKEPDDIKPIVVEKHNKSPQLNFTAIKYVGVSKKIMRNKKTFGYVARIEINKKSRHLGQYKTPELAAYAYDCARNQLYGEKYIINYIQKPDGYIWNSEIMKLELIIK